MGNFFSEADKYLEKMDINIYSPIFEEMLESLNNELLRVVRNVFEGKFDSGNVKLNLKVEINEAILEIPKEDKDTKEIITENLGYKRPKFEYDTSSTLNKKHKTKGEYDQRKEIVKEDDKYIIRPVYEAQTRMAIEKEQQKSNKRKEGKK